MAELDFAFDEVLAEIEKLTEANPDGWTVAEMARATGHGRNWCREKLADLVAENKAQCVGRAKRTMIDGRRCFVPVYKLG